MVRKDFWALLAVLVAGALWARWLHWGVDWSRPFQVDGVGLAMTPEEVVAALGEERDVWRQTPDGRQQRWEYPGGTQVNFVSSPGSGAGLQVVGVLGDRLRQGGRLLLAVGAGPEEVTAVLGEPTQVRERPQDGVVTWSWFPTALLRPYRAFASEEHEGWLICNLRNDRVFRVGLFMSAPRGRPGPGGGPPGAGQTPARADESATRSPRVPAGVGSDGGETPPPREIPVAPGRRPSAVLGRDGPGLGPAGR